MHFIKSVISFVLAVGGIYGLNILSFSGGGAFGAVEIGIIKKLQSESNTNTKYDIYTGISSGGINAGYLSHFNDLNMGIEGAEQLYSNSKNPMVYSFLPFTKVSLLNTSPFKDTLNNVISPLSKPYIPTYIGATNLYSGNLDIFRYDLLETVEEKVNLLMSTSAIPILFPPINFNGTQYTDGGILQNDLLDIIHDNSYINITFITPTDKLIYKNKPINSLLQMNIRTKEIINNAFENSLNKLYVNNDKKKIGEINKYYVDPNLLTKYNKINFNKGKELIDIGYNNVIHEKYILF